MSYKYDPINKILIKTKDTKKTNDSLLSDIRSLITKNYPNAKIKVSSFTSNSTTGQTVEITNLYPDQVDRIKNFIKYSAKKNNFRIVGNISSGRDFVTAMFTNITNDSKTVDYSYNDAARTFAYLDKEVQRDLKSYVATIQKADTSKKCEELNQIIRDLMEDYMDEYLEISNQVSNYSHKMREQTQTLFSSLMSQCFKKYNELKKEGK